jgi:hypothetical protein
VGAGMVEFWSGIVSEGLTVDVLCNGGYECGGKQNVVKGCLLYSFRKSRMMARTGFPRFPSHFYTCLALQGRKVRDLVKVAREGGGESHTWAYLSLATRPSRAAASRAARWRQLVTL